LAKRLIYLVITIWLILSFNFLLFRVMPGDVTRIVVPKNATPEVLQSLKHFYGLDKSLPEQYVRYLSNLATGHLGESISFQTGWKIEDFLFGYLMNTLVLVGFGTVLSIIVGIWLGRYTAWKRGQPADRIGSAFFLVFYSMPTFLFALVMLTLMSMVVPAWPIAGAYSPAYYSMSLIDQIGDRTVHTILPLFALVIETIATFSIITRSSLIDVMTEEYMVTAVAKGLRGGDILRKHAMPNAMLPVVTVVAMNVGWVLSGSIMIEMIFTYQGLGYLTYYAVTSHDYPVLQASFMLEAIAVVIANFIADVMLIRLDPRVKV
jgi:peptide/nickel transport system permease protein